MLQCKLADLNLSRPFLNPHQLNPFAIYRQYLLYANPFKGGRKVNSTQVYRASLAT